LVSQASVRIRRLRLARLFKQRRNGAAAWYFNGNAIPIQQPIQLYQPLQAGNYRRSFISTCSAIAPLSSDDLPVSDCPVKIMIMMA
jgi:hypothetical protein